MEYKRQLSAFSSLQRSISSCVLRDSIQYPAFSIRAVRQCDTHLFNVFKLSSLTTPAIPVTVPAHLHPTLYSALLTLTLVNISAFHSLWSPSSSQWSSEVKSTRLFRFLSTTFQPTTLSPLFSPFLISTSFTFGTSSMFYLSRLVVDWSIFFLYAVFDRGAIDDLSCTVSF